MGRGDEAVADAAAVEAMHKLFPDIEFNGHLVLGEGDEDSVPMLYIDEALGTGKGEAIEVVVDALEGATSCALGAQNAIAAIAVAEEGGFLRCPVAFARTRGLRPHGGRGAAYGQARDRVRSRRCRRDSWSPVPPGLCSSW